VTFAPFSTRILHTRDPVNPPPPKTVTDSEEPGERLLSSRARVETIEDDGIIVRSQVVLIILLEKLGVASCRRICRLSRK